MKLADPVFMLIEAPLMTNRYRN
ncbi:hypothetical protein DSM3645_23061 [Blastopirellula marina DSM 3645]|uniref:Uncharacterized protein n=1 Tax=Blastopirellula marina DSM 3645 TaxID=314230 RepID=A3ZQ49_9BACT|nr:hypothetical protein DSM3645_23061 [Blastopirellula marina DSM 3645]